MRSPVAEALLRILAARVMPLWRIDDDPFPTVREPDPGHDADDPLCDCYDCVDYTS